MHGRPKQPRGRGLATRPSGENDPCVTARGLRVRWRGGALTGGSAVARRRQSVADEHRGVPGRRRVRRVETGPTETVGRRWGGGVSPVVIDVRGGVLQLKGDPGVRRRWSIEGKIARRGAHRRGGGRRRRSDGVRWRKTSEVDGWVMGTKAWRSGMDGRDKWHAGEEKVWPVASGSVLRGAAGRGGPKGWTPRGGRAEEREGERGALGTAVCHRRDSGPATARAGGAVPRDSGGRRGRRGAVDAVNRWAGV
jgi:hypothetical protein